MAGFAPYQTLDSRAFEPRAWGPIDGNGRICCSMVPRALYLNVSRKEFHHECTGQPQRFVRRFLQGLFAPAFYVRPLHGDALPEPSQIKIDVKRTTRLYRACRGAGRAQGGHQRLHRRQRGSACAPRCASMTRKKDGEKLLRSERYYGAVAAASSCPWKWTPPRPDALRQRRAGAHAAQRSRATRRSAWRSSKPVQRPPGLRPGWRVRRGTCNARGSALRKWRDLLGKQVQAELAAAALDHALQQRRCVDTALGAIDGVAIVAHCAHGIRRICSRRSAAGPASGRHS